MGVGDWILVRPVAQCAFAAMWGRLLTCGRLLIGLPGMKTTAWLQPCCPTIRRGSQRNEDLVVQALACAHFCNMDLAMSLIAIITPIYVSPEFPSRLEFFDKTVASVNKLDSDGTPH